MNISQLELDRFIGRIRPRQVITPELARSIARAEGTYRDIAERFKVGRQTVSNIKAKRTNSHWTYSVEASVRLSGRAPKYTLADARAIQVDKRPQTEIAAEYGLSTATISKIQNGKIAKRLQLEEEKNDE